MGLCILSTSPHAGGSSDTVLSLVQRYIPSAESLQLRDYTVHPCTGCGACHKNPAFCSLDGQSADQARELLDMLHRAEALCIIAPVYFYGLPAYFKGLVDRCQPYYEQIMQEDKKDRHLKPAYAIFPAGRSRGDKLFEGSRLSLRPFLWCLGFSFEGYIGLKGLDASESLLDCPSHLQSIAEFCKKIEKDTSP